MKNEIFPKITSLQLRKILILIGVLYFTISLFLQLKSLYTVIYFLFPVIILLVLFYFLDKHRHESLFLHLKKILGPLASQMNLGSSFITAWQNIISESKESHFQSEYTKITNAFKFQAYAHYANKRIENLVQDLVEVRQSHQPLRRLEHLRYKLRIEDSFYTKSKQALFQLKLQSEIMTCLYFGLLIWVYFYSGTTHLKLILLSAALFGVGTLIMLKIGRSMKWSL